MDDTTGSLFDKHIEEYDMRLRHIDELLMRAQSKAALDKEHEAAVELARLQKERDRFASWVNEQKIKPLGNWRQEEIEKAGPMGVWDAVAQQLERLVERLER